MLSPADIPVFVLCGGLGSRLGDAARSTPKPMLRIGDRPMISHVMGCYDRSGFRRFVLCAGYRADVIGAYFLNYASQHADFTVDLRGHSVAYHQAGPTPDWEVTVAHTGAATMTGGRIARAAERHLGDAEHFAVTYGDGLTDADLGQELAFHLAHDRLGTMLGVNSPSPFGRLELHEDNVEGFAEKPTRPDEWINGGFFIFRRAFLDYLSTDESCVLEAGPLARLVEDRQLKVHRWQGYWSCVDTVSDQQRLSGLWEEGAAPWKC